MPSVAIKSRFLRTKLIVFSITLLSITSWWLGFALLAETTQLNQKINIRIRVKREQVEQIKKDLDFNGSIEGDMSTVEATKGLPMFYIFTGIVLFDHFLEVAIRRYRDLNQGGGIVVKTGKDGKSVWTTNPGVPFGTIVDERGKVITKFDDTTPLGELILELKKYVPEPKRK